VNKLTAICLLIVGLINFLPVLGILSAEKISQAYLIQFTGNDIAILMRHRALLFGLLGGFILSSIFIPIYQVPAMIMAAMSMAGFIVLAVLIGGYNAALFKVILADVVGLIFLTIAAILKLLNHFNA